MSKNVKIPDSMSPFVVYVNGKKYIYPAGETVEVPDEVAVVIEQHNAYHEKKPDEPTYYEGYNIIKEMDFGMDADEYGYIRFDMIDFYPKKTYVLDVNGTMIDIVPGEEYGSGRGEYNGKLFGYDLTLTCTNARCKAAWKVKLMEKVYHPVLDKPYVTLFSNPDEPYAFIDADCTIKATKAYIFEAAKAGKQFFVIWNGEERIVCPTDMEVCIAFLLNNAELFTAEFKL